MQKKYMDLHIHLGRDIYGHPVKITASNKMTLQAVIDEAVSRKGMDIIGLVDCLSPAVLKEIEDLLKEGVLTELTEGGFSYKGILTILPGAEIEIYDERCRGPVHVLCYFPDFKEMQDFSVWCRPNIKNIHLSTQRIYANTSDLQKRVKEAKGWFIPAHVFTPFKSVYGKGADVYMAELFNLDWVDAVELGLSADLSMAETLPELDALPFLTNSDAHSVKKIGREHQVIDVSSPTFAEVEKAIKQKAGRKVVRNTGLHPELGKYYQTVCGQCFLPADKNVCLKHPSAPVIKGVKERTRELAMQQEQGKREKMKGVERASYLHHIPLEFIPGIGPKTVDHLITLFGSEMAVLHEVPLEDLVSTVTEKQADFIKRMREGRLKIQPGGGGKYGKVKI
ncbi:endonuclease Q family protein [Salipaludibacillus sp. CUR1]|uniref:endonuclease Q family protein n=1 Tax=Salipaludibacillus sp. CUR1 TaxID=2820003 RepID=UPI001E436F3B|nr:endonuclease Q family protein [Salipaludibacillus sp. CUR1]MCE7794413.1 endonuclease Q family protein [Salipaludibacillus sp. CUR1]